VPNFYFREFRSPFLTDQLATMQRRYLIGLAIATGCSAAGAATLQVRASASLHKGQGAIMEVRVNGARVGTSTVTSPSTTAFRYEVPALAPGSKVDVVFTNDASSDGEDRNLFVESISEGSTVVLAASPAAVFDRGAGPNAFDGVDVLPGQSGLYWAGALRVTWPQPAPLPSASVNEATRFLLQASFGPRPGEAEALANSSSPARWIDAQLALPARPDFVSHLQAKFAQGASFRPGGTQYDLAWLPQRFWATATNSPDQLRKRMAWALHQIWVVSLVQSDLFPHGRAYAQYLDTLNRHALGNYRQLMEDVALSPAMGIFLSHIRNRKEDPVSGRMPDENFARELMQLFTIGLYELKPDGSLRLDASGQPIETYNNADVMALAKVFTGYSWAFPDGQLNEERFRWHEPDYKANPDPGIDLLPMKAYPGQSSTAAVTLFAGKPNALTLPANTAQATRLKLALDTLFNHPNVGPFVARQLIQKFTTSNPSPAYVQRVAAVFANNGRGTRGDLGATVRAILLDAEARQTSALSGASPTGAPALATKLRDPVLRVAHWLRAFEAKSPSGEFRMNYEHDALTQPVYFPASVFSYYRPAYSPPGTALARFDAVAPELQIVNESTAAQWVNRAESMAGNGLGWNGKSNDAVADYTPLVALLNSGNAMKLVQRLNQQLFAGRMSVKLQNTVAQAMGSVSGNDAASQLYRARLAVFLALSSPEFTVQP
jgi:uncharacterized protein (DUF1800 family)